MIEASATPFHRTILMTLYATGARRAELAHLKVADIDSERMLVHIRSGKGRKDRDVMLSPHLLDELRNGLKTVRLQNRPSITDLEFAFVAIAYNTGGFNHTLGTDTPI